MPIMLELVANHFARIRVDELMPLIINITETGLKVQIYFR